MRTDSRFPRLHIVDHPLIEHKLSLMRDKNTGTQDFRTLLHEIALLMGYEVTRDFPTKLEDIETPICATKSPMLVEKDPVIVPVLRAGLGMTDGLLACFPPPASVTSASTATPSTNPSNTSCACPTLPTATTSSSTR